MNYFDKEKTYGLPKPKRKGNNTGSKNRKKEYVHKVTMSGYTYYKVHIGRNSGKQSKIKYFKSFKDACMFVELLRQNRYI